MSKIIPLNAVENFINFTQNFCKCIISAKNSVFAEILRGISELAISIAEFAKNLSRKLLKIHRGKALCQSSLQKMTHELFVSVD